MLTQDQQDKANAQAQLAIECWEYKHEKKNNVVHQQMEIAGI